jgi:hypothetical protein
MGHAPVFPLETLALMDVGGIMANSGVVLLALFLITLFLAAVLMLTARSDRL